MLLGKFFMVLGKFLCYWASFIVANAEITKLFWQNFDLNTMVVTLLALPFGKFVGISHSRKNSFGPPHYF